MRVKSGIDDFFDSDSNSNRPPFPRSKSSLPTCFPGRCERGSRRLPGRSRDSIRRKGLRLRPMIALNPASAGARSS
ncbi:MAG: hypothetical protein CMJ27_05000 [Phycisphaerae bacterium]|nr:hypothetical protein [Phycisphaerae bacterium]